MTLPRWKKIKYAGMAELADFKIMKYSYRNRRIKYAGMAELADAAVLGAATYGVQVQILLPALKQGIHF